MWQIVYVGCEDIGQGKIQVAWYTNNEISSSYQTKVFVDDILKWEGAEPNSLILQLGSYPNGKHTVKVEGVNNSIKTWITVTSAPVPCLSLIHI